MESGSDLFVRQPAQKTESDDGSDAGPLTLKKRQGLIQSGKESLIVRARWSSDIVQNIVSVDTGELSTTLIRGAAPSVVDEVAPHLGCKQPEERRPRGEVHRLICKEAKIGLVNQRGGLQCMVAPFVS
jgi:hypothetical protein